MKIAEYGGVSLEWLVYGREPSAPSVVCEELNKDYCSGQDIEKEIGKYSDKIINHLVLLGTDRVIAEKMLEATIQEIKTRGKGDEGYINLGDFLKDAQRRLKLEAAREARAAEEKTGT